MTSWVLVDPVAEARRSPPPEARASRTGPLRRVGFFSNSKQHAAEIQEAMAGAIAQSHQIEIRLYRKPNASVSATPELLTNIVADVGIEADVHGCSVALETARPLEVNGDPELLRSAMENVIRNAVRYAPAGSKVGIEARRADGRHIEVIVWDHGPGVPEKDLELIFEPFYRVDAARNRAVGGDGLGLAIAARAVAIHGGTIQARNLGPGGLAVQLSLPALDATPRLEQGAAA